MSNQIEINIDAPRLTPDKLQKAVDKFVTLLKGVSKNATGNYAQEDWGMEVKVGSTIFIANPLSEKNGITTDAMARGIRSLMSGIPTIPQYFTKDEVEAAKGIAALIDDDGRYVRGIFIQNGGGPIHLSSQLVKTADLILAGDTQIAFGSVEGKIEGLHRKEDHPITSTLRDPIYGRVIACNFNKPELEEEAFQAFKEAKRVLIYGLIHYSKDGYPIRIDSDFIRVFPPESELPTLEEIHAFFK
jgi:hypothetical protein